MSWGFEAVYPDKNCAYSSTGKILLWYSRAHSSKLCRRSKYMKPLSVGFWERIIAHENFPGILAACGSSTMKEDTMVVTIHFSAYTLNADIPQWSNGLDL